MPASPDHEPDHPAAEAAFAFWEDAFGLALVLVRDRGRAEELAGEAFLRLVRSKRPLDASRSLRPLVLTTVRNLCLNDLRKKRPESLDAAREAGHEPHEELAAGPVASLASAERREAVQAALAKLTPRWREMVYLCDGLGASYREIAAVTDTTEDVVRTTLSRARARLRELLSPFAPRGNVRTTAGGTNP
jgi:RNA polymerase sigma-70 factor (ECF subfamily)